MQPPFPINPFFLTVTWICFFSFTVLKRNHSFSLFFFKKRKKSKPVSYRPELDIKQWSREISLTCCKKTWSQWGPVRDKPPVSGFQPLLLGDMRCDCEWHKNADVWAAQCPHSTPTSGLMSTGGNRKTEKNPNILAEANWCQNGCSCYSQASNLFWYLIFTSKKNGSEVKAILL